MKTIRSLVVPLAILIGVAYGYSRDVGAVPVHSDELVQLWLSQDLMQAMFGLGQPVSSEEAPDHAALNQPLMPFLLGVSRLVQGYGEDQIVAPEDQAGRLPLSVSPALAAARMSAIVLTALTASLLFALGRRFGGWPTGLIAAGLFALNPVTLLHGRRALPETLLLAAMAAAALALVHLGLRVHRAWRRQRDAAVALEVTSTAAPEWSAQQMRIETAREREQSWRPPNMPSLMPPNQAALPAAETRDIVVAAPEQDPAPRPKVVMPSPVAGPRWQAEQMRIKTAWDPDPTPGSTRPGHRLSLSSAWSAGWRGALGAGVLIGLAMGGRLIGAVMAGVAVGALIWILWPRVETGLARVAAALALSAVCLSVALATWVVVNPGLVSNPLGGAQILIQNRIDAVTLAPLQERSGLWLTDPLARMQAAARSIFFAPPLIDAAAPPDWDVQRSNPYFSLPLTAPWPQPWAGIVALCAVGLGVAAAVNRARRGGVAAIVMLLWLGAVFLGLAFAVPVDVQSRFMPLLPPACVLAAFGLTALISARGDLRALGRA